MACNSYVHYIIKITNPRDSDLSKFKSVKLNGVVYNFGHLSDFVFNLTHGTELFKILVRFSHHCFTEKWNNQTPDLKYQYGGELRAFSRERYELSFNLQECICELVGKTVYYSRDGNFFFVTDIKCNYAIYFNAIASKGTAYHIVMNVESAYPKKQLNEHAAPVGFGNLIAATFHRRKPPLGRPVKVERH
jgi:hypothetical protein